jgi:hypothetical protein
MSEKDRAIHLGTIYVWDKLTPEQMSVVREKLTSKVNNLVADTYDALIEEALQLEGEEQ